jgi:hypothetical protein
MKKASELRLHADECRALARGMAANEQRDRLLEMAAIWEKLAAERSDLMRHSELTPEGEHQQESTSDNGASGS